MPSGALIAAGVAVAGGLGYLWWQKRKAAAAAPGSSGCKEACLIAAKAMGQVGSNLETYCNTACAALDQLGGLEAAGGALQTAWQGITGQLPTDPRGNILETALVSFSGAKCPDGSTARTGSGSMLSDHRTGSGSTTSCVDAAGKTIGTLTSDGKFNPYTIPSTPAPVVAVPMPTNTTTTKTGTTSTSWWNPTITRTPTTTTANGGVTVTERAPTPCESCKAEMAKLNLPSFYCSAVC